MTALNSFVQKLKANEVFAFISSVKLAAPLMLILCACVATGTIYESLYNAEYASLVIYKSSWFMFLLVALWVNIFCSTISRIPYRKYHIGFVTTHIGLLTLLIGGLMTARYGTDGQLQVVQGDQNSSISLQRMMIGYQLEGSPSVQSLYFDRDLGEKSGSDLDFINRELGVWFKVNHYLPFAKTEKIYRSGEQTTGETSLSFVLKSQFFNVTEWLSTNDQSELKMGPATLRIVRGEYQGGSQGGSQGQEQNLNQKHHKQGEAKHSKTAKNVRETRHIASIGSGSESLTILDAKSGKELRRISIRQLAKADLEFNHVTIHLKRELRNAIVSANKLTEGDESAAPNPAIEIEARPAGEKQAGSESGIEFKKEILYARHKNFSLHPEGVYGLKFVFERSDTDSSAEEPAGTAGSEEAANPHGLAHPSLPETKSDIPTEDSTSDSIPMGNTVEFHVPEPPNNKVQVVLIKNRKVVQESWLAPGENLQTPWMGMQIFLGTLVRNSEPATVARAMAPEKRSPLPPSAVEIKPDSGDPFWLAENEEKVIQVGDRRLQVFYGRESFQLPFEIYLEKFSKVNYPGTETALSFESIVRVNKNGPYKKISMNDPLKIEGFTVYQSSYVLNPGAPPISVFSVNKDPGRPVKYAGSVLLAIGVILFTLMRSRAYNQGVKTPSASPARITNKEASL